MLICKLPHISSACYALDLHQIEGGQHNLTLQGQKALSVPRGHRSILGLKEEEFVMASLITGGYRVHSYTYGHRPNHPIKIRCKTGVQYDW